MINEILLIASVVVFYGAIVILYRFFGIEGLFCWMSMATVLANIEVLRVVDAFGFEQTLGNVLFASTFLVTDILNEEEGKESASKAAWLGIISAVAFAVIAQSWLLYNPSSSDWAGEAFETIFSMAPRIVGSSVLVFGICQHFDVWLYRRIWKFTTRLTGSEEKWLWVRNNASTLTSQAINTVLYNLFAFYGIYSGKTLISICVSCYLIFIITSLADTPAVYIAKKIKKRN